MSNALQDLLNFLKTDGFLAFANTTTLSTIFVFIVNNFKKSKKFVEVNQALAYVSNKYKEIKEDVANIKEEMLEIKEFVKENISVIVKTTSSLTTALLLVASTSQGGMDTTQKNELIKIANETTLKNEGAISLLQKSIDYQVQKNTDDLDKIIYE